MLRKISTLRIGEKAEKFEDKVAEEIALSIYLNGRLFVTAMASPGREKEFVLGNLFAEGLIKSKDDVESLTIDEGIARVLIPSVSPMTKKFIVSGCGGNSSFLDDDKLPKVKSEFRIDMGGILKGILEISDSQIYKVTGGIHSCGLFSHDEIFSVGDIGRHNALDKVIGWGLMRGIDFSNKFVVTTGRISSEMVLKCSRANIPIIASRGAVTSLSVEIARRTGLTIIGFVRGKRLNVYANEWRINEMR